MADLFKGVTHQSKSRPPPQDYDLHHELIDVGQVTFPGTAEQAYRKGQTSGFHRFCQSRKPSATHLLRATMNAVISQADRETIGHHRPRVKSAARRRPLNWLPPLFIVPAVALVFLVTIYPVFDAAVLSLFETQYAEKVQFVGFDNFIHLATDPLIANALSRSLVYTLGSLAVVLPLSLGLALLLNEEFPLRGLARTVIVLPWVVSQTVVALLWAWLLNADFGPVTYLAQTLLGYRPLFLASPTAAMASTIVVNVWASYPQATLLLLAALQTIPNELYDAAKIDGTRSLQALRYVTLPLIKPTIAVVLIQLTLLYFNMVTLIYTLTGGGPMGGTETLSLRVLKTSFEDWNLGQGAALGLVITVVNFAFSLIYVLALRSRHAR
ncbi:sugar ABC transporter permease [Telmatospirillum sp.]|uniref:carbohydrate ABC transporter permease n=1 Tax=Telmatospirillum sp. TaxID=2079197 RepID=UPI00284247FF|nr:sugar ABC transporter permease [Telmatospirillum sp.]MDR3436984.1 sugar ABC transporter permease [Telmatospirillum sp.]